MTQAPLKLTYEQYLAYDDRTDNRYEFVDGGLVALPPESGRNDFLAVWLQFEIAKLVGLERVRTHSCEVEVPVLRAGDARNRFPDLVVLTQEHLELVQKRLTITLDMPVPLLIAEVVSPGQRSRDRDYKSKPDQYCQRGVPEYWSIDPEAQTIVVFELKVDKYVQVGSFRGQTPIVSPALPALALTAEQILTQGKGE